MECPHCHTPLDPGSSVCPACKRPVSVSVEGDSPPQRPTTPDAEKPRAVDAPLTQRPTPSAKKGQRTLLLDFNQSPREIVRIMDETVQKVQTYQSQRRKQILLLWLLFPLGLPFICADVTMGYNICTFSLAAIAMWLGAVIGLIIVWKQGKILPFGSRFDMVRLIFDTLRDDVSPKRTLIGWLDLTGATQESKKTRQKTSASGQPIIYYRDEWLRLKTGLYDGSVLRVSLIERVKARQSFWKRGSSGKLKLRSGSSEALAQLEFSISVDTGRYTLLPFDHQVTTIPNSRFVVQQAEVGDGRVAFNAATVGNQFDAWDILNALRFGYDYIASNEQ